MRQYEDQKEKVKQRIQSAKSRIHISCDLWTSPNSLAILGIVSHYVTEDGQLEHHILALKDVDSLLRRYDIQYDPKAYRLRFQGHIINLAAKAFLFVTDNKKLERDEAGLHTVTLKHIEAWPKKGPLGRLHNFDIYI
ncbi:hypothetical protein QSH57_004598 [Fusarium oxysporum f. sp. vasinfectum]|nr:hypothetical protein QSH57_004598 [Fusarium oxysporum f. sp. vasinfectum]